MMVTGTVFYSIGPDHSHYYQGSLLQVELLQNTPSPRIILAGGSNVAWGIDSELMEQRLGIPVINQGLDAHLGIAPIIELKQYIRPGDIIIISLEYYSFANVEDFYGFPQNQADWVELSPQRIKYLHNPALEAPAIYLIMLQRKINRQINYYLYGESLEEVRGLYSGENFDSHGDFVGHLDSKNATKYEFPETEYPVNLLDEAYGFLEGFRQYAAARGAIVFYEAQAHRQTNCNLTGMKYFRKFYSVLQDRTKIPVLTHMNQLCLPDEYFFDTPYHLNAIGRNVRTERLIENLKEALDSNPTK